MMKIIDQAVLRNKEKLLAGAMLPIRQILSTDAIERWCLAEGHEWRERRWGPAITVLACVWKQLKTASVRQVEDWATSLSEPAGR